MKDIKTEKEKFKKIKNITSFELSALRGVYSKAYEAAYQLSDLLKNDEEDQDQFENNEF